jgi:hypothetical protein
LETVLLRQLRYHRVKAVHIPNNSNGNPRKIAYAYFETDVECFRAKKTNAQYYNHRLTWLVSASNNNLIEQAVYDGITEGDRDAEYINRIESKEKRINEDTLSRKQIVEDKGKKVEYTNEYQEALAKKGNLEQERNDQYKRKRDQEEESALTKEKAKVATKILEERKTSDNKENLKIPRRGEASSDLQKIEAEVKEMTIKAEKHQDAKVTSSYDKSDIMNRIDEHQAILQEILKRLDKISNGQVNPAHSF